LKKLLVIITFSVLLLVPVGAQLAFAVDPPPFILKWGSNGVGDGQFSVPSRIAVDSAENVYVADSHRIQKFDSTGTFLRMWGFGVGDGTNVFQICTSANTPCQAGLSGAGDGQFSFPKGIAFDSAGNVYVADSNNHRIQKFDSTGTFLTKWGSVGTDDDQFVRPFGVAVDSSDNVYVVQRDNDRVKKFDSSGTFLTKWGSSGSGDGQFQTLRDVAVDSSDHVYVVDEDNDRVQKFDSTGTFLRMWGFGVGDGTNVFQICTSANTPCQAGLSGAGDGQFNIPFGVAVDSGGTVYVAELSNDRIQRFDSSGTFLTKWGSLGVGDGQFDDPQDIAVDSDGNVYVADSNNHRIQKFGFFSDIDQDGVFDSSDNCPLTINPSQTDTDLDGLGDACDICPVGDDNVDTDFDGIPDACDTCPGGDDNIDTDFDGIPDACDTCPGGDDNIDTDFDGIPDACDPIPELSCGLGTTEVANQCLPDLNQICGQGTKIENMMCVVSIAVGGVFIGIDKSALFLAATQLTAAWMIPTIVAGIGFAKKVLDFPTNQLSVIT